MIHNINRIIVIDDNPEDYIAYQRYIQHIFGPNIEVITKEIGADALLYLENNKVDCVLLDYQLPDMTGINFLQKFQLRNVDSTPVIMLTGQGNEKVAVEALKTGASDYLIKDEVNESILYKSITNVIEKIALIKKIKKQEEQINYIAYHDYLTGIPNRLQFDSLARQALMRTKESKSGFALLFIDLNNFKSVNDSFGHAAGDDLLKEVVKRFQSIMEAGHTLGRLGGDEFALITEGVNSPDDAFIFAKNLLASLKEPINVLVNPVYISASIGIVTYPSGGASIPDLLRNADIAMYQAKKSGKNIYVYVREDISYPYNNQFQLEAALRKALSLGELDLNYQPIVNLSDNEIYALEVLLRWNSEDFGTVGTEEIITLAEKTDLITLIGAWVLETALRQFHCWVKDYNTQIKFALNISPKELNQDDWFNNIETLYSTYNIDPSSVILELTETALINNIEDSIDLLESVNRIGSKIFVDDFGTGYSSLTFIRQLPVSGLKIDISFIQGILKSKEDENLVKSILILAENMGLTVIAEGVETEEQLNVLKKYSNEKVQGFYIAKPMSASEIGELLRSKK